ncbi:MAG TPA: IPT/TIG domain-containing protein [Acidimicrobiales bacterium]
MSRPSWRLVGLVATGALLVASCSASPAAVTHPNKGHVTHPSAIGSKNAKSKKPKSLPGTYENGSSITGNSGPGVVGSGTPGVANTAGGVVNTAGGVVNMTAGSTTTLPGTPTTEPQIRITKTGRVLHRHLTPVIQTFRPQSSPVGATVIIVGKRLRHATTVAFDGIPATITSNSSTRIKAIVPSGATSGPISVITASGSATVSGYVVT